MARAQPGRVVVACAADDAYAMPLAVALRSAAETLSPGWELLAFVLDGGVRAARREQVARSLPARARAHWVPASADGLAGARVTRGRISGATYFRLGLGELLPESVDRVLYLDADVVVCGDLAELWRRDLAGRVLLAVRDAAVGTLGSPLGLDDPAALRLDPGLPYFNAGVLLVDLARWRRERVAQRVRDHLAEHGHRARFWDQDGLNAVLAGRWGELPPRWNQIPQLFDTPDGPDDPFGADARRAALADPGIVHYATWSKPWHFTCAHPERARFYDVLDRTAWAGWRPRRRLSDTALLRGLARVRRGLTRRAAALRSGQRAGRGPSGR